MKIEDKLLKLRKEKGLSQEEVADRLNVSRQTISKWETGQSTPDFDKIIPLCELYEISSDELLTGKKKEELIQDEKEHELMKAKGIGLSLGIYVLSIVLFVFLISLSGVIVALGIFFLGVIMATALFIYTCVMYKGKNDFKFLKKLVKKIDSTCILVIFTFINLIFTLLRNTWSWYNNTDIYHDALLPIVKLLNNDYITGLLVVVNIFIFILGIRFIINAFKTKKEVLLKVSFASLSILTSYFAVEIFTNLVLDYFLNI